MRNEEIKMHAELAITKLDFLLNEVEHNFKTVSEAIELILGFTKEDNPYRFGDLLRNKLNVDIMEIVWAMEIKRPSDLVHDVILPNLDRGQEDPLKPFREELGLYLYHEDNLWFRPTARGYELVPYEVLVELVDYVKEGIESYVNALGGGSRMKQYLEDPTMREIAERVVNDLIGLESMTHYEVKEISTMIDILQVNLYGK